MSISSSRISIIYNVHYTIHGFHAGNTMIGNLLKTTISNKPNYFLNKQNFPFSPHGYNRYYSETQRGIRIIGFVGFVTMQPMRPSSCKIVSCFLLLLLS